MVVAFYFGQCVMLEYTFRDLEFKDNHLAAQISI